MQDGRLSQKYHLIKELEIAVYEFIKEMKNGNLVKVFLGTKINKPDNLSILLNAILFILKLLNEGQWSTKRNLYYLNAGLFKSQRKLEWALKVISNYLQVSIMSLNVVSTAKGIIFGRLRIHISNQLIDCSISPVGTLIPSNISFDDNIYTDAEIMIIVEKDAVFQHMLLNQNFAALFPNVLLVTGKGYPDIATRRLLRMIQDKHRLPAFILVDADPYGFEIFLLYKYGKAKTKPSHDDFALEDSHWLGLWPSEISSMLSSAQQIKLTKEDIRKIELMRERKYISITQRKELDVMLAQNVKAELEYIYENNLNTFCWDYIPRKLKNGNWK